VKVYVITKGDYSDYHICAVATNQAKARMLAEFYSSKYEPAEVEEYDTKDVPDITEGKTVYRIKFDPSGNAVDVYDESPEYWNNQPSEYKRLPGYVNVTVLAKSMEAAIKIGAEKRAQFLAERMGL